MNLLFAGLLCGREVAREALPSFPADTQQFAYLNLAQLRSSPGYPHIRQLLLNRELRHFQDFLRSTGTDFEKDVDQWCWDGAAK